VNGAYHVGLVKLLGVEVEAPLWTQLVKSALPFFYAGLLSLFAHGCARLGGSRRPYRSSVAVALYATGPMMLVGFVAVPAMAWGYRDPNNLGSALLRMFGGLALLATYVTLCSAALATLHGVKRRWPVMGLLAGYAVNMAIWFRLARAHPALVRWLTF
jgi:hypothetical protein